MNKQLMTTTTKSMTKPESRYRGDRRATTVVISEAMVRLAQQHFPETRHNSLSGFIESALASYFRKSATKLRKAGMTLPAQVFTK